MFFLFDADAARVKIVDAFLRRQGTVAAAVGDGKNLMVGNLIELQFGQGRNWPLGSATSIVLILLMALMLTGYGLVLRRLATRTVRP